VDDALPLEGGETRFASATAAFESLPETEQAISQTLNPNPTPQTLNPKPYTPNPKP